MVAYARKLLPERFDLLTPRIRALHFVCLFAALGPRCIGQQSITASTFNGEPFTMNAVELQAAAAAMAANEHYPAQILLEEGSYRFAANGTLLYQHRMIYRVDSQAALENWSVISAEWEPWFENPAQLRARVLKTDGHFVELDQKTITDAPVKETETDTFSSEHVRRAPLPGMSVGAIVEEVETTEEKKPYFSGGGVYSFQFSQNVPVGRARIAVELPTSVPFNDAVHSLPGLLVSRSEANERRYVVRSLATLRQRTRTQHCVRRVCNWHNFRMYPEAADVLSAGVEGGQDASSVARQIAMFRGLTASSVKPLPPSDPGSPVQTLTFGLMAGTLTREQVTASLSREGYSTQAAYEQDVEKTLAHSGLLWSAAQRSNISETVLFDLIAGNIKFTSTGNDNDGFAVTEIIPGAPPEHTYVIRENGALRILGQEHDNTAIGNAVLKALGANNTARAKAMLDWRRDLLHKAGGDDPFSGPLLPRFWTVGSAKEGAESPAAMRIAAISLLGQSMTVKPHLAEIAAAREKATGQHQTDLDLLLAEAAIGAEDATVALPAAKRLLEQEPDSATALRLAGAAYMFQNNAADFQAMLAPRLSKRPTDRDLLMEQERAYALAHDFAAAQATAQKVLDSGKAEASDYNSFAWLGLFTGHVGEEQIKAAQQSNMLSKNGSFGDLHTLACVYAAEGRTTEARQVLDQAMTASQQSEPNSAIWYALGLIYEQYGETDAALQAYAHVRAHEYDDRSYIDATDTYRLAQARLVALKGGASGRNPQAALQKFATNTP